MSYCFKFLPGLTAIPKDGEASEDACYIHERSIGVADGVSGWNAFGLNAAEFSSSLINNAYSIIVKMLKDHEYYEYYSHPINPFEIIEKAYSMVKSIGSSTISICALNNSIFQCANLGDSGFILFRYTDKGYILKEFSRDQQHEFNTPCQLSNLPKSDDFIRFEKELKENELSDLKKAMKEKKLCHDSPSLADRYNITVCNKDILIVASDGVLDNLFLSEIKKIIDSTIKESSWTWCKQGAQTISENIGCMAYKKSKMDIVKTPFGVKYEKHLRSSWPSGKEDDITVAVGLITKVCSD